MKRHYIRYQNILLIMILFSISICGPLFGQVKKSVNHEYIGTYKTNDPQSCPMEITITYQSDGYHYKIVTSAKKKEGRVKITKMDKEIYMSFVGLLGKQPKTVVEGQYMDNSIVIQNYGNAMNKYLVFSECDAKYIELLRVHKK